ncbi:MAG TPA: ComEC/Rec2 family competence protein [Acidimicrobiia bacterium]|nr:ComEC/Rec2 family competence protein [Acidimicrobiia bacterium]
MRRAAGPVLVVAALVVGVLAGGRAGAGSGSAAIAVAGCGAAFAACARRRGAARVALGLVVIASAATGAALMQRALDGLVHSPLSRPVRTRTNATISGSLADDPDATRFAARVLVRVARFTPARGTGTDAGGRTVVVHASGDAASRLAVLEAGDRVTLRGWYRPLDGFEARFRWRHAVGAFETDAVVAFAPPDSLLTRVANGARNAVLRGTLPIPPVERAVVAGFLVGDTRDAPEPVIAQFRASGLSHLLVVSGENVAFVLALAGPLLRRLPRHARFASALSVLVLFGTMTRWEPSVLRACAMAACSLLAVFLGRPVAGLRPLAIAVAVLLVADPFLVHSVGFALSCAACLGIAVAGPWCAARLPGPAWFRESLGATLGAQLGVAPVLIPVFGSVPLVSLPANLLAVPLAGPLTVWGLVAGVLGGVVRPVAPPVARVLQIPTLVLVRAVMTIAAVGARSPVAVGATAATVLGGLAVALGLLVRIRRRAAAREGGRMLRRRGLVVPPG